MKRYIKANESNNKLVDVYVKVEGEWKLLYQNIPESIAQDIWMAGFQTGENLISIEDKEIKSRL